MAGISSKAAGKLENKYKFSHQLIDDDLGLNIYQFRFRNYDPQIGRFVQIDPLASKYAYNSTYAYAENKLGLGVDLEGLELAEFNKMFNYAGINVDQANRNTQVAATRFAKKMEPAISVAKDVVTISAGVTLLVASGGTAAPLIVGLGGSATVVGGTMKLAFDISGNPDIAKDIPTTIMGTAAFEANGISQSLGGKKVISDDVKTIIEFSEGVMTLNVSGFSKMKDVEKASTVLSGLSLSLDGLSPEMTKAIQTLLGGNVSSPVKLPAEPSKKDNTNTKAPIIDLPKQPDN